MKLVGYIAVFLGGCVIAYLVFTIGGVQPKRIPSGEPVSVDISLPTYLSFVSVMLTAVTVVLAALAIGIGVVAFYTVREIKDEAQKTASKVAKAEAPDIASEALSEVRVKDIVKGLVGNATQDLEEQNELGDYPDDEER
ncbi:MAG: hypothetical protein ACWA40_01210 [Planktomarina sp.]